MNWVDLVIIILLAYYAYRGFDQGIISILIELGGYIAAYFIALKYSYLGTRVVSSYFHASIPAAYETTIGLALVWTATIVIYYILAPFVIKFIPPFISHSIPNKIVGVIGSLLKGLFLVSILLLIVSLIPLPAQYKNEVIHSYIGGKIIKETTLLEKNLGPKVATSISQTISQLTLLPANTSSSQQKEPLIYLGYQLQKTNTDPEDETVMFNYVNAQRKQRNIPQLKLNSQLTNVARMYGKYMFAHGFFSHITPSGQSPYDRVKVTNLSFVYVGENIAKAPDVATADTGFMNSPEHKANILDKNYQEIGIGVIDGGSYGKMFIQDFIGN